MPFSYLRRLPPALPRLLFTAVDTLVTNDEKGTVLRNAYALVEGGRYTAIGTMKEMPVAIRTAMNRDLKIFPAPSLTMTPGLLQGHTHLSQSLGAGLGEGKTLLAWLRDETWPKEAAMTPTDLAVAAHLGAAQVLLSGTTTVVDMATVHHTPDYAIEGIGRTGLRVFTGPVIMDLMDPMVPFPAKLHENPEAALRRSERELVKLEEQSRKTGRRINPIATLRFLITSAAETARSLAELAKSRGWPIQTHASESPGEVAEIWRRFGKENIEMLAELGFLGGQTFLHHVVHATDAEMALMAQAGAVAVHCPSSNGMLGSGIARVRDLLTRGVRVCLGADGAPCNDMLDVRLEMHAAKLLAGAAGQDARALSPQEILTMVTTAGAKALGMEGEIGRIAPGHRADAVFWSNDDLTSLVPLDNPGDIIGRLVRTRQKATHVFIDGQQVVANRSPPFIGDPLEFRRKVRQTARSLSRRAQGLVVPIPILDG